MTPVASTVLERYPRRFQAWEDVAVYKIDGASVLVHTPLWKPRVSVPDIMRGGCQSKEELLKSVYRSMFELELTFVVLSSSSHPVSSVESTIASRTQFTFARFTSTTSNKNIQMN